MKLYSTANSMVKKSLSTSENLPLSSIHDILIDTDIQRSSLFAVSNAPSQDSFKEKIKDQRLMESKDFYAVNPKHGVRAYSNNCNVFISRDGSPGEAVLELGEKVKTLSIFQSGRYLIVATIKRLAVYAIRATEGKSIEVTRHEGTVLSEGVTSMTLAPDDKILYIGRVFKEGSSDKTTKQFSHLQSVRFRDSHPDRALFSTFCRQPFGSAISALSIDSNSRKIAIGLKSGMIFVHRLTKAGALCESLAEIIIRANIPVTAMAFEGKRLIVGDEGGLLQELHMEKIAGSNSYALSKGAQNYRRGARGAIRGLCFESEDKIEVFS